MLIVSIVWTSDRLGHPSWFHHREHPLMNPLDASCATTAVEHIVEWGPTFVLYEVSPWTIVSSRPFKDIQSYPTTDPMCFHAIFVAIGKEKEVLAMKRGGNKIVNAIFEATLQDKSTKPDKDTELDPRSEFVYQKYQHRTWYQPPSAALGEEDPFADVSQEFQASFSKFGSQEFKMGSQEFKMTSEEFKAGSQEFESHEFQASFSGFQNAEEARDVLFSPKSPGIFGDFSQKARISLISNLETKGDHANVLGDIARLDIGDDPLSPQPKFKRMSSMRSMLKKTVSNRSMRRMGSSRALASEMELNSRGIDTSRIGLEMGSEE